MVFLVVGMLTVLSCSLMQSDGVHDETTARERKNCWDYANAPTLLAVITQAMQVPLEPEFVRDNYFQTFGCAYEEIDIEKNAIQAVYRAIQQSLRNRNLTVRDNLMALLQSRPPRPDNLIRDYTVYVNMRGASGIDTVASYQIKILQLEVVPTVESPVSIWARVATRFRYREDHFRALPISDEKSAFVKVMEQAQHVLMLAEKRKFDAIIGMLRGQNHSDVPAPRHLAELVFGDQVTLVEVADPARSYPALFLGKGILLAEIPRLGGVVFKLGEERLFGLQLSLSRFQRLTGGFAEFGYRAPETILRCLFLKSSRKHTAKFRKENTRH